MAGPMARQAGERRPVGIVIPAYGHPQFLAEAISSACEQDYPAPVYVVVVDDQCRFEDTARVSVGLQEAYPGKLFYLRQKNTRLPGARNAGIRFLLAMDNEIDAIFLLDADNRLMPHAMQRYRDVLGDDERIGWAYPDIAFFGLSRVDDGVDIRETAPEYSVLKHLNGNISEAGSLVRADLFRKGVLFDEEMKFGLEDWDFWLTAVEAGYRGVRARDCGFLYRRRPESMIADSQRMTTGWLDRLRAKHSSLLSPRAVVRHEHEEAPAFAIWLVDSDRVHLTSDPYAPGRVVDLATFRQMAAAWIERPEEVFFPTHVFAFQNATWDMVRAGSRVLRYLFWRLRNEEHGLRFLKIGRSRSFALLRKKELIEEVHFACWNTDHLAALAASSHRAEGSSSGSLVPDDYESGIWAQTNMHLFECPPVADLPARMDEFVATLRYAPALIHSRGRRFAGPLASKVREDTRETMSLTGIHYPYPCLLDDGPRHILAVRPDDLASSLGEQALGPIVQAMAAHGAFVVAAEGDTELDLKRIEGAKWLPPIAEIIPQKWQFSDGDHAIYLGRRLPIRSGTARVLSIPFQQADTVIVAGGIGSLEVLGSTRHYGARCIVLADERLPSFAKDPAAALHAILALEHAANEIWAGQQWIADALVARGVPAGKIAASERGLSAFYAG